MPKVFIVAGPNGVGKTSYARTHLPLELRGIDYLNADLIAAGLSPFNAEAATFQAGRIMLGRINELIRRRVDFAFETTLSGRAYVPLLEQCRSLGYRIRLDFLWVDDVSIARRRIDQRVRKGGHNVSDEVLQRRFHRGIRNLAYVYRPTLHEWRLIDYIGSSPELIASERDGELTVLNPGRFALVGQSANVAFMTEKDSGKVDERAEMALDPDSRRALNSLRRAFAMVVLENLAYGLPVIQGKPGGGVVQTPAEQLEPLARRLLEVGGEALPEEEEQRLLEEGRIAYERRLQGGG